MNQRITFVFSCLLFLSNIVFAQVLPTERSVDWSIAGVRGGAVEDFSIIDLEIYGVVGDGQTPNDVALASALSAIVNTEGANAEGVVLKFPEGDFLFTETINLQSNCVLKGQGADQTMLTFNLTEGGHAISIKGADIPLVMDYLMEGALKGENALKIANIANYAAGDWVKTGMADSDLVTSSWAENTVGQIVEIEEVQEDKLMLTSSLRIGFDIEKEPFLCKIEPIQNVGIECLKINRIDNTAPQQSSNIYFENAVNCWVSGIESNKCTFSHIEARFSSNLTIASSYFHDAFEYGEGGRAYGVLLHFMTNESLVENNVFEHLRHSMILQAGANGNVFSYNYSRNPYWTTNEPLMPANAAGDIVLHGNYPFANLFEGNICQNIVIDNSHGKNGKFNTFLRNRAEGFGIFFSADNSPGQNFIGNEIPNVNFPYSLVNYSISGDDHFIYGNNNKGTITPAGTESLVDRSYRYTEMPSFLSTAQWGTIGTPNIMGENFIPAIQRYESDNVFAGICGNFLNNLAPEVEESIAVSVYPNPMSDYLIVESPQSVQLVTITNEMGQIVHAQSEVENYCRVNVSQWSVGMYYLRLDLESKKSIVRKVVLTR